MTSSYQHKLEPPIRNGVVVAFHTFQYIYIVICSLWLAVFATCNGSAKSAQWIQGNLCIVFGSTECLSPKLGDRFTSFSSAPSLCEIGTYGSAPGVCTVCGGMNYSISKGSTICLSPKLGQDFTSFSSA